MKMKFTLPEVDEEIRDFLNSLNVKFTDTGFLHYYDILVLIKNKLFSPERPESKFITLCFEEKWKQAYHHADTRNKEAFGIDMFQKFNKHIKNSSKYIIYNRERKLQLLDLD